MIAVERWTLNQIQLKSYRGKKKEIEIECAVCVREWSKDKARFNVLKRIHKVQQLFNQGRQKDFFVDGSKRGPDGRRMWRGFDAPAGQ